MKRVHVGVPDDFKHHRGQWGEGVNSGKKQLAVHLKSGTRLSTARSYARGWPEDPAGWTDVEVKYHGCCDGIFDSSRIDRSIAAIQELDTLEPVKKLLGLLQT